MTDTKEPVSAPLRRLGVSLLTLTRIRLELLAIEAQEEKERIASLLIWAVVAALLAGFGLLMLVLWVTVALWDSYRLLAVGIAALLLLGAAIAAVLKVRRLLAQPASLFQASIGELRADADALRRKPGAMIPRIPDDPRQRAQRKANLLLASELMRGQANLAFDDIGGRADGWAHRLQWIRGVFSQPAVLAAASGGAAFFATAGKHRRGKLLSMLRWGWLAWRLLRRPR